MHPFRAAVEAHDAEAAAAVLADDVVFHSPTVFKPFRRCPARACRAGRRPGRLDLAGRVAALPAEDHVDR
jgi:hypothetical protein